MARLMSGFTLVRGATVLLFALASGAGDAFSNDDISIFHWAEGSSSVNGAGREFYNLPASLKWRTFMGDWSDANDVPQGNTPYSTVVVVDDDSGKWVELDATELVREWITGAAPNKGFFLRNLAGNKVGFLSREASDSSHRPQLVVQTSSQTMTLSPEADTFLEPSTYKSQGNRDDIWSHHLLIRFDLSTIANGSEVQNATLRMYTLPTQYGNAEIGLYRCTQGHEEPPTPPQLGLAARYPADQGVAADPDVYIFTDFERPDWGEAWTLNTAGPTLSRVETDVSNRFEPIQGTAMRVTIFDNTNGGMSMLYRFQDEVGEDPEEVYFRYYLRIGDNWETTQGGKLPGISGAYGTCGNGGDRCSLDEGWTSRGSFEVTLPAGNPAAGRVPIGNYVYHGEMEETYGDQIWWTKGARNLLEKNRWYCVEQYIKMNTPGQNNGIMRSWVDGHLAYEKTDWRYTDVDAHNIEQIWANIYHGGLERVPHDVSLYMDNIVIAKAYIGPSPELTGVPSSDNMPPAAPSDLVAQ